MYAMYIHTHRKVFVYVGGIATLMLMGVVWQYAPDFSVWLNEPKDVFARAEYYFNADDDPGGAYDLEKARYYYKQAILASSTEHALAWYQLGRIDFLEGKFDAAIYKFNKQIEYFGDHVPNVYYMLGLTYGYKASWGYGNDEDWERGEEGFLKYMEYDPRAPWPRVDLAWIYFAQGKYEEMLPVLEEGLAYEPDNAWLLNMYGLALLNTGNREKAHEYFIQAEEIASTLTTEDWGTIYPGNDPASWKAGLDSFRETIGKNIALTE